MPVEYENDEVIFGETDAECVFKLSGRRPLPRNDEDFIGFPPLTGSGGRKKLSSEEEKKASRKAASAKYMRTHRESVYETAREWRKKFRDPSLPLEETREGSFQCTICNSVISSHKTFKIHAATKRHQRALEQNAETTTSREASLPSSEDTDS